jgi:hypothetical protein
MTPTEIEAMRDVSHELDELIALLEVLAAMLAEAP